MKPSKLNEFQLPCFFAMCKSSQSTFVRKLKLLFCHYPLNRYRAIALSFLILIALEAQGQNMGNYRSVSDGNWNNPGTWEYFDGTGWVAATYFPGQLPDDNEIFIIDAHTVTLTENVLHSFATLNIIGNDENNRSTLLLPESMDYELPVYSVNLTGFGAIFWNKNNIRLLLPAGASISITEGGRLLAHPCSNTQKLYVGIVPLAACKGGGNALYIFEDLITYGGSINVTAGSNSPVCQNEELELTATPTGPGEKTYTWEGTGPEGYTFGPVSGQNQTIGDLNTGTYTFTVTIADQYGNSKSDATIAEINENPEVALSGETIICLGESAELTFDLYGEAPWSISFTDGTDPVTMTDILSSPLIVTVTPTITTTYSVSSVSDVNCTTYPVGENVTITVDPDYFMVELTLFLEGLFNTSNGQMNKACDYCPVLEEIIWKFDADIADLINIELHASSAYGSVVFQKQDIPLHQDGSASFCFPASLSGSYYITVKNRNHLETVSALPVDLSSGDVNYDFTNAASQAFGDNMKEVAPGSGVFAIYAGDVNQDGVINISDREPVNDDYLVTKRGYFSCDINGDAIINTSDREIVNDAYLQTITKKVPD